MPKSPRKREPDVSRALNALRWMVRGLRSAAEAIERDVRISAAQLFVLSELAQVPDQSVKDLAAVTPTMLFVKPLLTKPASRSRNKKPGSERAPSGNNPSKAAGRK